VLKIKELKKLIIKHQLPNLSNLRTKKANVITKQTVCPIAEIKQLVKAES